MVRFIEFLTRQHGADGREPRYFAGVPDAAFGGVPMSRAEQDAAYLQGIGPQREESEQDYPGKRFVRFILPVG